LNRNGCPICGGIRSRTPHAKDIRGLFKRCPEQGRQQHGLTLPQRFDRGAGGGAQLRLSVRVAKLERPEQLYLVTMRDVTAEQREHQDIKHAFLVISRILAITDDAIAASSWLSGRSRTNERSIFSVSIGNFFR
jgi:hypothetical protein